MTSEEEIQAVWEKGKIVVQEHKDRWRQDDCTAWIYRDAHGDRSHEYGWEIDHIKPLSEGGSDDLSNKRPLHWKNNQAKLDKKRVPCVVRSEGSKNVEQT
jgi:5-methylcytosine-specific restriction endonuclease McrA